MKSFLPFLFLYSLIISVSGSFELVVVHSSSIKSQFAEFRDRTFGQMFGGCARVATVVNRARSESKNVLYLDSGDVFTGTAWFTVHREKIAAAFVKALKPDAMCLGNHEFDLGVSALVSFIKESNVTALACNIKFNDETELEKLVEPYKIFTMDDVRVAVIGYASADTAQMARAGSLQFTDETTATKRYARQLARDGVNVILALGHGGYTTDQRVAKFAPDVDAVFGGHGGVFQYTGKPPAGEIARDRYPKVVRQKRRKPVPVAYAYARTKYVGRLRLVFDADGRLANYSGRPVLLNESVPQDGEVLRLLDGFKSAVDELNRTEVGRSRVLLDAATCRVRECNFGNFVADSLVKYRVVRYEGPYWSDTSIAIINAGAVRETIDAFPRNQTIYMSDLYAAIPYFQDLHLVSFTGNDLLTILEDGLRGFQKGGFLMWSGLVVSAQAVHSSTDPITKNKVERVLVRCTECEVPTFEPLDAEKQYNVITTGFLLDGGDGYLSIKQRHKKIEKLNATDIEAVAESMKTLQWISPEIDGRLLILNSFRSTGNKLGDLNIFAFIIIFIVTPFKILN